MLNRILLKKRIFQDRKLNFYTVTETSIGSHTTIIPQPRTRPRGPAACLCLVRGQRDLNFPYGPHYHRGRCNDDKSWKVPNWSLIARYPHPAGIEEIRRLDQSDPSGSREGCVSQEGVFDLTGNAAEWVRRTRPNRNNYSHVMKGC